MRIITKKPRAEALRAAGKRLTRARRVILASVQATDVHPSAAAVYRAVRRRLPRVSLATVYRNLRMLAAEGLLSERAAATGMRFDGNTAPHDHFTCVACGRIYDVPAPRPRSAHARRITHAGFEVLSRRTEFYGRCNHCRALTRNSRTGSTPISRTPSMRIGRTGATRNRRGRGEPSEGAPTQQTGRGEPFEGAPRQRRKPWQGEASRAARASRT